MNKLPKVIGCCLVAASLYSARADEALTYDERIVALTILGEARGEGQMGMGAVACVIQNRMRERKLSGAKVCLQSEQFDTWKNVKRESQLYYLWKSKSTLHARKLARLVCKKSLKDITGGANHFCTLKSNPYWIKGEKPIKTIGNHKFFKLYNYEQKTRLK